MRCIGGGGSGATEAGNRDFVLSEFNLTAPAGWSHSIAESEDSPDSMAWVANVPVPSNSSWTFPPEEMLRVLPPDGIAVTLEVNREVETCAPMTVLHLAANDVMPGRYEGQPAEHVSSGSAYAVGRVVSLRAGLVRSRSTEREPARGGQRHPPVG